MGTALVGWTLRRALRNPLGWLVWAASLAAPAALELFSPIGLTTRDGRPGAWFGEVLIATALAGAVFALEAWPSVRGLVARSDEARRAAAGWTTASFAVIFTAPCVVLSIIFHSERAPALLEAAAIAAHVAALAWLLALLPIPDGARSFGLVFLAWLLAGWISSESLPTAALSALVDVSRASRLDLRAATWSARIAVLAPIIVLVGVCLTIRPARDPA